MSLDVTLKKPLPKDIESLETDEIIEVHNNYAYYIKYDDYMTFEEWYEKEAYIEVYSANITHNLGHTAGKAGIYEALWRPHRLIEGYDIDENNHNAEYDFEETHEILAKDIIKPIEKGLKKLKGDPEYYKTFDSPNGWGTYKHFVPFVEKYLEALKENPNSIVVTSR